MIRNLSDEVHGIKECLMKVIHNSAKSPETDTPDGADPPKPPLAANPTSSTPGPSTAPPPTPPPNDFDQIVVEAVVEVNEVSGDASISSIEEFMECTEADDYLNLEVLTNQQI